jgi:hypothetical protein
MIEQDARGHASRRRVFERVNKFGCEFAPFIIRRHVLHYIKFEIPSGTLFAQQLMYLDLIKNASTGVRTFQIKHSIITVTI